MTDPGSLRASDADRETVVRALTDQLSAGRLSTSEFDERTRAVYAAKTYADLVPITADLPLPSPLVNPPGWVGARPGAYPVPQQSRGTHPVLPNPRAGYADDAATGQQRAGPTGGPPIEVVGPGPEQPRPGEGYGGHYPFGWQSLFSWQSALAGYFVSVLVLVVIWAVAGFGYFWPGWIIGFGLLSLLGRGGRRYGRRR